MNVLDAVKAQVSEIITEALKSAIAAERFSIQEPPAVRLEPPKSEEHGDLATPIALALARQARMAPRAIAQILVDTIQERSDPLIDRIEIAGPGFINFFFSQNYLTRLIEGIQEQGDAYGRTEQGRGERIVVEFVSANPTGPLNIVSGRAAATGDALVNILNAAGYDAIREYYVNDAGGQTLRLAKSVDARYRQLLGEAVSFPEDGYQGDYVTRFAQQIVDEAGDRYLEMAEAERLEAFWQIVYPKIRQWQQDDLERFGVFFDVWTSEKALRDAGKPQRVLETLKDKGLLYEADGAIWFRTTAFGDEKDCVVVKSDGEYTYLTPDMAYHQDKFERGFHRAIDLFGPDHHAQIARLQAAMKALGYGEDRLQILIVQQVNLVNEQGERVDMSKRKGQLVTLGELIDQLSETVDERFAVDVARYFFLMRSSNSHLDFDLSLAVKRAEENPVFYLQYAHARVCSLFAQMRDRRVERWPLKQVPLECLESPEETRLIKKLGELPEVIQGSAQTLEVHRLPYYLQEVASLFHTFYNKCRVLDDSAPERTQARLVLADCVRIVMRNGLALLGISAPETM